MRVCPNCGHYWIRKHPGNAKRDAEIVKLKEKGLTNGAIATKFGMTRERVMQIMRDHRRRI